jgi:hypothetical protein
MKIVERGALFLDEVRPGWATRIDPDTLDLASSCDCVLGQLYQSEHPRSRRPPYESYDRMVDELDLGYDRVGRLGFVSWGRAKYENMTAAWRREIAKRQPS